MLSGILYWTQTKVKHWQIKNIYIIKKIWKIVTLLGYPNKMLQYHQWNPKCSVMLRKLSKYSHPNDSVTL